MENTNEYVTEKREENKFVEFIKKNLYNLILVVATGAFLIKDFIQIKESGRTIAEIIASTIISLAMGLAFKFILDKKGIIAGQSTDSYMNMMKAYENEIKKTDDHIDKLDEFCDKKNDLRIRIAQTRILRLQRIKYVDFIEKEKEEVCKTEEQKKSWDKAMRVKIHLLTPENLLSETDERYEKGKKEQSIVKYERNQKMSQTLSAVLFALIFGYFTVELVANWGNLLWSLIQVATWLFMGLMGYIQNYFYIKEVYQQKIYRKIMYLTEFNMKKGEN